MSDLIEAHTKIVIRQLTNAETVTLIEPDQMMTDSTFMLIDIIITSTSNGVVTLVARDDEHTHVILSTKNDFNHNFANGWSFWRRAKLDIVKEIDDGVVNVSIGYVRLHAGLNYNQWSR